MQTIYHAESVIDAHLLKDRLDGEGIPAFIAGEYLIGGIGQLPARDLVTVGVPDSCVDQARPVVEQFIADLAGPPSAEDVRKADRDFDDPNFAPDPA
ncbi:MAG TPA: DUF2007 domain-containing protein [Rhodanobacteraceae bacterium]